ncbi:MAG: prepilin-type N-terminal cleavage/methylation domain-containing protein [Prosthecobacter sp.]|jgi:prepilin-type N-terminal cleavage/methylation domain-containing protein|uniref:pilus assembly FimT family protein n=1 Tax=Prosthecobacter sp. TaxID=1965333 RepID=UPI0019FC52AA|nr:prepilin-type N-terminal cleavage/methylation domain-containing protein [Prosthecobacter sp.]MBE2282449.1 prepilin-type N-terminal cleavage/methylation domain-containing protein [Prosthecobacter sp.]
MKRAAAFTLLEMIVVLAIAALIIGISAGAVVRMAEENEMHQAASTAERVLMEAMTRTLKTSRQQEVRLQELAAGMKLTVQRVGYDEFEPADEQRLWLRPGGLCEPLTLRWQRGSAWVSATLDPLTGGFAQMEEYF